MHFEYTNHWDKDEETFRNEENMTALKRIFKNKITIKGGKGQIKQKKADEEEARKREKDASRLAQEAESWLKSEEEERKKVEQEAAKNAKEAVEKAEEDAKKEEEERKKKEDEELKKKEAESMKLTGSTTDQQTSDPTDTQEVQDQDFPDSQQSAATAGSNVGQVVASELRLIPFEQKKGEEVPDFSTIFYNREKKRIVKRIEKKVETGGQSGMMVTDKTLVHGVNTCISQKGYKTDGR